MSKILLSSLMFIFILNLSFCQSEEKQTGEYSRNVKFEITKFKKWKRIQTGSGHYYPQGKGTRYFVFYITLTNNSNSSTYVDFRKFFIKTPIDDLKLDVKHVLANGLINIFLKTKKRINPKSTQKVKLAFIGPKEFTPDIMIVNGNDFKIPSNIVSK